MSACEVRSGSGSPAEVVATGNEVYGAIEEALLVLSLAGC